MNSPPLAYAHNGGVLSLGERWRLALDAVGTRLALLRTQPATATAAPDWDAGALADLAPPTGVAVAAVHALAAQAQPDWLTAHALRTYAWAAALARSGDLSFDRELLFAACLLHDVGLVPAGAEPARECFALRGARYAQAALPPVGWTPARATAVAQAIALHLDVRVAIERGAEAHLLHAGAGVDVLGLRWPEIAAPVRQYVLGQYPRPGFKRALCDCLRPEIRRNPHTRIGVYGRWLGMLSAIRKSPLSD
ncbi:MAG: HD domain-containing protein [Betaproteobacteria bacterium]